MRARRTGVRGGRGAPRRGRKEAAAAIFLLLAAAAPLSPQDRGAFGATLSAERWGRIEYSYSDNLSVRMAGRIPDHNGVGLRAWYAVAPRVAVIASLGLSMYGDVQGLREMGIGARTRLAAGRARVHAGAGIADLSVGLDATLLVVDLGVTFPLTSRLAADLSADLRPALSARHQGHPADVSGVLPRIRLGLAWERDP